MKNTQWQAMNSSDAKQRGRDRFNDNKYGMLIHWGLYSQCGGIWKGEKMEDGGEGPQVAEWIMRRKQIPRAEYAKLILTEIGVGTVKTHPPSIRTRGPFFSVSAIEGKLVAVVKRPPVIGPTVVRLPGHVAALKKQVAGAVVAHNEDHVTLKAGCGSIHS